MPEEMIVESWGAEADEADEAWESDDAFDEADDSVEDLGERTQQRRRRRYGRYRPGRGVRGMTMRDADGRARNVAFPARLATTAETNRGLAGQEVARRALEERLNRLETRNRAQLKNGSAISGIVTLLLGGGLTAFSLFKAQQATTGSDSLLNKWSEQSTAQMATLSSVSQLAATGAKMLVTGQYHRSGIGIAADAFAAVQIAGFTVASFTPSSSVSRHTVVSDEDGRARVAASPGAADGDLVYDMKAQKWFVLSRDFVSNRLTAVPQPSNGALVA
ncbi:hypothetical protein SAMN02990966_07799 [Rhodospirillales bacterium URHD0017]|nr:hypothetical protein SAMN02990966_07799 [Rhodospirillales bacterium URHD0017]